MRRASVVHAGFFSAAIMPHPRRISAPRLGAALQDLAHTERLKSSPLAGAESLTEEVSDEKARRSL